MEYSVIANVRNPSFSSYKPTPFLSPQLKFNKSTIKYSNRRNWAKPVRAVNEKVVRIDLGTTNSAVAAMEGGQPTIITNAEGQRTTPLVVAYTKNSGDRLVGQIAKRQAVVNPENTFFSVKRFIGRKWPEKEGAGRSWELMTPALKERKGGRGFGFGR